MEEEKLQRFSTIESPSFFFVAMKSRSGRHLIFGLLL